jgi:ribose-phosphate pyrophosphokinase
MLAKAGAVRVDVAATHALFSEDAAGALRAAGVGSIWTTDTVRHPTNAVRLAGLLADALRAPVDAGQP